MTWITPLDNLSSEDGHAVGGKGAALIRLNSNRVAIPRTLCVTTQAYQDFVDHTGLREKIQLELSRKVFSQMRWEEIWDASQRLRLLFLRSPMPSDMETTIRRTINQTLDDAVMVVRSSGPDEDRQGHSFAGLHASYTHLQDVDAVIRHIKMVWASLWSDAALLYRQELGLDSATSTMAVLIQEMVAGQASGIFFTRDPVEAEHGIVEAIHGMNPPLVDGHVSPDRWRIDMDTGAVIEHTAPDARTRWQPPLETDVDETLVPLPEALQQRPPLSSSQLSSLWQMGVSVAAMAGSPQDIEWTFYHDRLVVLQARPITATSQPAEGDSRAWYLSLHRSLDNLLELRQRIETVLIPDMQATADELRQIPFRQFSDAQLAGEIRRRWKINQHWVAVYWEDFIPFAHGMRLFGQLYNQVVAPEDPYAFMQLLKNQDLLSVRRNQSLGDLAADVRHRPERIRALQAGRWEDLDNAFREKLEQFVHRYGDLSCPVTGGVECAPDDSTLANMLIEMARLPTSSGAVDTQTPTADLEASFMDACPAASADDCRQLLSVARASYRLRDDDNIILGAIEARLIDVVQEGRRRVAAGSRVVADMLAELGLEAGQETQLSHSSSAPQMITDRQITGQPAGPGVARGSARVITQHGDIAAFKRGEIIVCDGVDPNMTFVMPLAAAIVERRGGMLIHGAIIAREYGLPCVTGVADATSRIRTGQTVTVDGYLGIVTIGAQATS